jgi:phage terminase large subunit-like protein
MYVYDNYIEGWHTKLICDALERVEKGEIRFLIIEAPPRHSKSVHVSQLFPAWVVGKEKDTDVIVASYSGDLATDHGRETRNLIETKAYQNVFKTRLAEDSAAKGKWNTNGKGSYNAVGVGGSATGKGADFFVVDDPFKDRKEADSMVIREDRWKWLRSVARTRLSPTGAMIIMHTRWHEDDIIGRLTVGEDKEEWVDYFDYLKGKRAKWVRLTLTAIAEKDELYRKKGEPLWSDRYPLVELEDIKATLGPYEWGALYQARPVDDANRKFKKEWFHYRTMKDLEKMRLRKFATIDPNLKKSDESDYCGVSRIYVNDRAEWHVRSNRYRVDSSEVINLIFLLHDEGMEKIGVEEGAFSYVVEPFLKEEMRKRGKFPNVVPLKHGGRMKETRIEGLVPWYNNGNIWHIVGECEELEEELLVFPRGVHDDCADSLAYAIAIVEKPAPLIRRTGGERKRVNIAV